MIDNKFDSANLTQLFQGVEDDAASQRHHEGIMPGGCYRPGKPDIFLDPIEFGPISGGKDMRDKYEREEFFEQPTGIMDQLVDIFGIDDTRVFGENGKIVVDAGMGNDNISVTKGANGGVNVEVNGRTYRFTAEQAKNLEIRGGSGNDSIVVADNVKTGITIRGGSGDDFIRGGAGNDMISGGSGNDTIDGGRGNDWIHGGSGNDNIRGGRGNDTIYAGSGNDFVDGGRGNDTIHGGIGSDTIRGGRGRDHITRDFADRDVRGGRGRDTVSWDFGGIRPFRPIDLFLKRDIRG